MNVDWAVAVRPKEGQTISGDVYVVESFDAHGLLVSVIDGLGGGREAYHAAQLAAEVLKVHPGYTLSELIRQSHQALHSTRGAVIGIVQFNLVDRTCSFVGVGNIGVHVYSSTSIKPISRNGILGYRLPSLLEMPYRYNSGDTFVLYSDGISSRFALEHSLKFDVPPQELADGILRTYGKTNDDATVMVVRCP